MFTHVNVYLNQLKHSTFSKTSESFQTAVIASFANYVLNFFSRETNGDSEKLTSLLNDFNKNNKAGYLLSVDVSSMDEKGYSYKIYKNGKEIGTGQYKTIKDEGAHD